MSFKKLVVAAAVAAALGVPASASATNGYFSHGWGTKSKAMAGVATALPQDTLVSATNPAGMAFVGQSSDIGISFFNPSPRGYKANPDYATQKVLATTNGTNAVEVDFPAGGFVSPGTVDSDSDWFVIPSLGYNHPLNDRMTIGVSIYGNGGMNTDYDRAVWSNFAVAPNQRVAILPDGSQQPLFATTQTMPPKVILQNGQPIPVTDEQITETPLQPGGPVYPVVNGNPDGFLTATGPTGVSLEQLFVEVPFTIKIGDGKQAFGIAPVFAAQSFEAKGLQPFRAASVRPDKVTNNGKDWSYGFGLHFGWYGEVTEQLALGISYRTKMWMSDFDEYSGLFANKGSFDIPAMFNFGVAYKATPEVTVAFDYQHIFYNEVDAISNSNDLDLTPCFGASPIPTYCLGGKSGLGFGWDSMDVFKLGVRWDQSDKLKLFGGVSYNTDFLKSDRQALFNVLTPATVRWHLTVGATYMPNPRNEINLAFAWMPKEEIDGKSPSITQTQTGSLYMEQKDIEISWSHHF